MNYKQAGVDISAGNIFVKNIRKICEATYNSRVISRYNSFCSLYENPSDTQQLLAASTDGVGTKLILAMKYKESGYLDTIGQDLVAMSVNDILTCGATPLFFLDYIAIPSLEDEEALYQIINGIAQGCHFSKCVLIGGETAEMPSLYEPEKMDLAGFAVGTVFKSNVCGIDNVKKGDVIIGLESSGPHSNGFSLINKIENPNSEFLDWCMKPTTIYQKVINDILNSHRDSIHAMAHITGGGLEENIRRVIPENYNIDIDWDSWVIPGGFNEIKETLNIDEEEMRRVFNLGIGYVIIAGAETFDDIFYTSINNEISCYEIGRVIENNSIIRFVNRFLNNTIKRLEA